MGRRLADGRHTARREHHERVRQTAVARGAGKRTQVARRHRREIRVGGGCRRALVFAKLGRDLVRCDDVHARMPRAQLVGNRRLVPRVTKRKQQAHRDGFCVAHVGQGRQIERRELALGADPPSTP